MIISRKYHYPRNYSTFIKYAACFFLIITIYNIYQPIFHNQDPKRKSYYSYIKYIDKYPGLGENGKPAYLKEPDEIEKSKEIIKKDSFNVLLSNKIAFNRSIPDNRPKECAEIKYDDDLPNASIVVIFNNEAFTAIIRMIWSIINRTPTQLVHQIILFDDFSDKEELKRPLDDYVRDHFSSKLVQIYRSKERLGLIRARIAGAEKSNGDVLVYLDAHCEVNIGWLEPLAQRIKEKRNAVLCPMIDAINDRTMQYSSGSGIAQGGFTWSLHFTWLSVSEREKQRLSSPTSPIRSPTMAGGLLALNREYFWEVGAYDPGMDIWGGENLEMSFRVWQCGGSLEFVPCSHVGHIFRSTHPFTWPPDKKDTHGKNSLRMARVWMDDYIRLFYTHRVDLKDKECGDISERVALRRKLKCKSFKWFLDNVFPEKFIPDENVKAYGKIMNEETSICFDMLGRDLKLQQNLGLYQCQEFSAEEQFTLALDDRLRIEDYCASTGTEGATINSPVVVKECDGYGITDNWIFRRNGPIIHKSSGLCIDMFNRSSNQDVFFNTCQDIPSQKWLFQNQGSSQTLG